MESSPSLSWAQVAARAAHLPLRKKQIPEPEEYVPMGCVDCDFVTVEQLEMKNHCCCQWLQAQCNGHRLERYYCGASCLDCGWGGCTCFGRHCCCQDYPPDCDGHVFTKYEEELEQKAQEEL
jgi:hypothetical protein